MKTLTLLALCLAAPGIAQQTSEPASLGIFAETRVMMIPGMKMRSMPKLPLGIKLPQSVRDNMPGMPSRHLTVRLWSPKDAPDGATANLAIPGGLQLGNSLDLDIYRPTTPTPSGAPQPTTQPTRPGQSVDMSKFQIKMYWGSSDTIQPGQPKIISLADLSADARAMMQNRMMAARRAAAGMVYTVKGSTASWPGARDNHEISKDASLPGTYTLNTSYTGTVTLDAPSNVDFLAPIDLVSPNLEEKVSLDMAIPFEWNQIPNCLGVNASLFAMEDQNTMVMWTASDHFGGEKTVANNGYLGMSEVQAMVNDHSFLPGNLNKVTLPAGMLTNASMAMFTMEGFGPGTAKDDSSPVARIQTKTSLSVMLLGAGRGAGQSGNPNGQR